MKINMHDTTPASSMPKRMKYIFMGCFVLIYSIFVLGAFAVICYANQIIAGILLLLLPFIFVLWFYLNQRDLANSYIEVIGDQICVVERRFGCKREKMISYSDIDHTELIRPYSMKLRGPRVKDIGLPYIVFYSRERKQLFKLLATPAAKEFHRSIHSEWITKDLVLSTESKSEFG